MLRVEINILKNRAEKKDRVSGLGGCGALPRNYAGRTFGAFAAEWPVLMSRGMWEKLGRENQLSATARESFARSIFERADAASWLLVSAPAIVVS